MTEVIPVSPLPTLLDRLIHDFAQKALTTVSAILVTDGVLTKTQSTQFVEVGGALALYAAGVVWTYVAAKIRQGREKHLLALPATVVK